MKAEEPGDRVPVVKYGMGAEYQDSLVERHFAVAQERDAIATFHFAHALLAAPLLRAAINGVGEPEPEPEQSPSIPTAAGEPQAAAPFDLRKSLGLS